MKKLKYTLYGFSLLLCMMIATSLLSYDEGYLTDQLQYSLSLPMNFNTMIYQLGEFLFSWLGTSAYIILIPILSFLLGSFFNYKPLKSLAVWSVVGIILYNAFISFLILPDDGLKTGLIGSALFSIFSTILGNTFGFIFVLSLLFCAGLKWAFIFNRLLNHFFQFIVFPFFFKNQPFLLEEQLLSPLDLHISSSKESEPIKEITTLENPQQQEDLLLESSFMDDAKTQLKKTEADEEKLAQEELKTIDIDFNDSVEEGLLTAYDKEDFEPEHTILEKEEFKELENPKEEELSLFNEKELSIAEKQVDEPQVSGVQKIKGHIKNLLQQQNDLLNRFNSILTPIKESLSPSLQMADTGSFFVEEDKEYYNHFQTSLLEKDLQTQDQSLEDQDSTFQDQLESQDIPSFQEYQYFREWDNDSSSTTLDNDSKEQHEKSLFSPHLDLPYLNRPSFLSSKETEKKDNEKELENKIQKYSALFAKDHHREEGQPTQFYGVSFNEDENTPMLNSDLSIEDLPLSDSLKDLLKDKESSEMNYEQESYEPYNEYTTIDIENDDSYLDKKDHKAIKKHTIIFEEDELLSSKEDSHTTYLKDKLNALGTVDIIHEKVTEDPPSVYEQESVINEDLNDFKEFSTIMCADDLEEEFFSVKEPVIEKSQDPTLISSDLTEDRDIQESLIKVNDYRPVKLEESEPFSFDKGFDSDHKESLSALDSPKQELFEVVEPSFEQENLKVYDLPQSSLLSSTSHHNEPVTDEEIKENSETIIETLKEFNIQGTLEDVIVGPVVTRYEISPPKGLKVNKIIELSDNIALGLASKERVRIEAPVYGKSVVGVEVANKNRQLISFKEILSEVNENYEVDKDYHIPFVLGKALDGQAIVKDIVKMPHLLIAGSTGSGKSVCINTLIHSILFYKSPNEVKLLLVDPKRVELILYDGLPHLISPVIKETTEAIKALKWLVNHMEERYYTLEEARVRNILEYNERQKQANKPIMPYLVVVMDEFADLILLGKREVEESVIRLAAMARAVGIHLILATQRPSADVITGLIKANFASRVAFRVSSKMESRIILDENGAEDLLGKGDMLFMSSDMGGMTQRIQAPFISDQEVQNVTDFFKKRYEPNYWDDVLEDDISDQDIEMGQEDDSLFGQAIEIILKDRKASASYLQRRLKIGYNRAARLIEMMEERGIVSQSSGSKPREILIDSWG